MQALKARNYCFTYNNYPDELEEFNAKLVDQCNYVIYGKEIAPTTGTPHLQGYMQCHKPTRITALGKQFRGCHFIVARGGYDANRAYCSKEGILYELGTPDTRGKRKGLEEACEEIAAGTISVSQIAREQPLLYARYYRGLEQLSFQLSDRRSWKTEVFWYWGATGSGKSKRANELEPDAYWKPSTTKWWNGYDGQDAVIIDDYRRDFSTFGELLRLFDRYPFSVETKGGVRPFLAKRIYITTPKPPTETWENRTSEDLEQLIRRIEHVEHFAVLKNSDK